MNESKARGTFTADVRENNGPVESLVFTDLTLDTETFKLSAGGYLPGPTQPDRGVYFVISGKINPGVFKIGDGAEAHYNTGKGGSSWHAKSGIITLEETDWQVIGKAEITAKDDADPPNEAAIIAEFDLKP